MTTLERVLEVARRMKEPLYLVTALYVMVGLGVGGYGAIAGDRVAACLGLFIVSGALFAAVIFHSISRLSSRLSAIGEGLDDLRAAVRRVEESAPSQAAGVADMGSESSLQLIDLASVGSGDPSILAGANLSRNRFPRLVPAQEDERAARGSAVPAGEPVNGHSLQAWKRACAEDDLATCRRLYSQLAQANGAVRGEELAGEMTSVAERVERALRTDFSAHVRNRDFSSALAVGQKITELFEQRPVASEFNRIRPLLIQQLRRKEPFAADPAPVLHPR